jgi:hypothetical protein
MDDRARVKASALEFIDDFLEPGVDRDQEFYIAMTLDQQAAHVISGVSTLDLNNVVLRTECNNAYETASEEDTKQLRKTLYEVYLPYIIHQMREHMPAPQTEEEKKNFRNKKQDEEIERIEEIFSGSGDGSAGQVGRDITRFREQQYILHLTIRMSQAFNLIFELNQKRQFSALAKAAYELCFQDVLYHPVFKREQWVKYRDYEKMIHFLRRHPKYAGLFNTYVGTKMLRQHLMRTSAPAANRKSNDVALAHDEAANRLWKLFDENMNSLKKEFEAAPDCLTMQWHRLYYQEVAETLRDKITQFDGIFSSVHGLAGFSAPMTARPLFTTKSGGTAQKFIKHLTHNEDEDTMALAKRASAPAQHEATETSAAGEATEKRSRGEGGRWHYLFAS